VITLRILNEAIIYIKKSNILILNALITNIFIKKLQFKDLK